MPRPRSHEELSSCSSWLIRDPQRAPRDLAMIQTRRAIETRDDGGQFDADAPLVGAAALALEDAAPAIPPWRDETGQRLDDEHAIAARRAIREPREQRLPRVVCHLVQRERGDSCGG